MLCYKGFNEKLQCQPDEKKAPFQFEVGKTYEEENAMLCKSGFHACENPLDVFHYYYPAKSRYCLVNLDEVSPERESDDSKICGRKIHIEAEIGLKGIIEAGLKFILDKVDFKNNENTNTGEQSAAINTGWRSAATNTGEQSAATNTGEQSAATNTGRRSAAINTGRRSAAINTGEQSAATNTGEQSAATVEGKESVAISVGIEGKAKGNMGSWIVLSEWENTNGQWHRIDVKTAFVDGNKIKADTFYMLKNGEFVECE